MLEITKVPEFLGWLVDNQNLVECRWEAKSKRWSFKPHEIFFPILSDLAIFNQRTAWTRKLIFGTEIHFINTKMYAKFLSFDTTIISFIPIYHFIKWSLKGKF